MTAKNFDRDLQFINTFQDQPGQSTSFPATTAAPLPRTDGVVYDDVGTLYRTDPTVIALAAGAQNAAGVIMRRPEVRGVYAVKGFAFAEWSNNYVAALGIAVAPAAPTGAATGEVVPHWQLLSMRRAIGNEFDMHVCIDNFGTIASTDYSERDIIFYVSVMEINAAVDSTPFIYNLSVQRLTVGVPEYESKYR